MQFNNTTTKVNVFRMNEIFYQSAKVFFTGGLMLSHKGDQLFHPGVRTLLSSTAKLLKTGTTFKV